MRILDVDGSGDCFFRAVSHQLYGEPSYHINVHSTGVQYMRYDPERFIESSTVTSISAVSSKTDTTVITIGHLDVVHYVSTVPFNEQAMGFNVIFNNQPPQLARGPCRTTNNNETIAVAKEQKWKAYYKEYMATRRRNNKFRNKLNRGLQAKRSKKY